MMASLDMLPDTVIEQIISESVGDTDGPAMQHLSFYDVHKAICGAKLMGIEVPDLPLCPKCLEMWEAWKA